MYLSSSISLSLFAAFTAASNFATDDVVSVVRKFPNETWLENMAVRSDGNVLVTAIDRHAVYQVDPLSHAATTVHKFPPSDPATGITEIQPDVFAVLTTDLQLTPLHITPNSTKLWKLDVGAWSQGKSDFITKIVNLPEIGLGNGMTHLSHDSTVVLIADSLTGTLWRVDTTSGVISAAIKSPQFEGTAESALGLNGVHVVGKELYFTNLAKSIIGKVALTGKGSAAGPIQNISTSTIAPDDFGIASDGTLYVAGDNTLWRVQQDGSTQAILGGANSTTVEGITAAQFGRTSRDRDVLYMTTQGGILNPPPGAGIHGGRLLAVNVGSFD